MKKFKLLSYVLFLSASIPLISTSCFNTTAVKKEKNIKDTKKDYLINEIKIEYEKAIKKIQNEFLELASPVDYLNSLEEKYTKSFHEKVQTFYDENYSKILNYDLKKFYTEWKDTLLEINNYFQISHNKENWFLEEFIYNLLKYNNMIFSPDRFNHFEKYFFDDLQQIDELTKLDVLNKLNKFNSLDTSNLDWSGKWDLIKKEYNSFFEKSYMRNKDTYFDKRINEIIDELDKHYQLFTQDAWMVTPKDELVDTSHFS
ncbi:hypothetical protein C4M96_03940, partial [Mycoplasmopsis pullorum]